MFYPQLASLTIMKLTRCAHLLLTVGFSLAATINSTGSVLTTENATTTVKNGTPVANPSAFATTISIDLQRMSLIPNPITYLQSSRILGSLRRTSRACNSQHNRRSYTRSHPRTNPSTPSLLLSFPNRPPASPDLQERELEVPQRFLVGRSICRISDRRRRGRRRTWAVDLGCLYASSYGNYSFE